MKRSLIQLSFLLLGLIISNFAHSTPFTSVQSGNWTDPATWDQPGIPNSTDDVIIDGHLITIDNTDGDVTINSITLTNTSNASDSGPDSRAKRHFNYFG